MYEYQLFVPVILSTCDTTAYQPFSDSTTCNYDCPAGTYSPYDKSHISLFIQYGNPNTAPTGTPSGYGNCQFFSDYLLKTGINSSCKFFNVWVCTYDSTCGGICSIVSYPSYCPDNENASLYQNKIRRYPEYVNSSDFISSVLSSNPRQNSSTSSQEIISECQSNCEAQADIWINQLKRCTTDSTKLAQLKQALINVCSAACGADHPLGASSIPSGVTATYHSFEEAIVGILGSGAVNDSCTAELLSDPYPYDKQPVYAQRTISETNYDICQQIRKYKTAYQASGFTGSFHSYLVKYLGAAYDLDSLELDDLLNSCSNCSGLLKDDIELPVFFEPNAPPCLLCDSIQSALTAFNAKFSGISTTYSDYEILFANFCNHRFGYSLTYDDYKTFLDSCTANSHYSVSLCNQPSTKEATVDNNGDDCMANLFATALTNANNIYLAYIDSVHRDFREAYMTRCLNVQPYLTMNATLWEYHYTLYYYDQSGDLVKTIPPEGVALLTDSAMSLVKLYRLLQNEGCYQYSDSIHFNNNGQINWTITDSFETSSFTAEMMLNLDSFSNQVLASKIREYVYSTDSGLIYRQAGMEIKVDSNKLAVNLYGIGADTVQHKAIAVSILNVPAILSLNTWTHLIVQRTGDPNIPVAVWVNGNPVALQFTLNDIDSAVILSGDTTLWVGTHNAAHLALQGKLRGTIKNLRIYDRILAASEIRQNAYNPCQLPVSKDGLLFWSTMNNAAGNLVKDLISQKYGTLTGFTWQPFNGVFPAHRLPTTYAYNSFNQILQQYSPDGDTSQFFYDRLGRLTVAQNKEQKDTASYSGSAGRFSYTKYDALGRTIEVGEKSSPSADVRSINLLDTTALNNWLASGTNRQITKTFYDDPVNVNFQSSSTSRKRVVASVYLENAADTQGDSTLYSYDILGNVNTLVQHVKALVAVDATNGKKRIDYDYDLVSGKVNMVSYQSGKGDQFFYKYSYDADNRIIRAYSSRDKLIWNEDASYLYYLHGPLARTELGHLKVQGIDYAYTLQGWLKGVNADTLNSGIEIGNDGDSGTTYSRVSKDAFAFQLGYYNNDYKAIGGTNAPAFNNHVYQFPGSLDSTGNQLFNGNISYTTLALSKVNNGATTGYSYGYDQLNRIVEMRQHTTGSTWGNSNIIQAYKESVAYDANGNILKYLRRGAGISGSPLNMDSLTYQYNRDINGNLVNNKLNYIKDSVISSNYTVDIDNQPTNNYRYDKIGNLISDASEGLDTIRWTVYGKINRIKKSTGTVNSINFGYDALGNRTFKQAISGGTNNNTYYIRDGQGNVLSVYTYSSASASLKWAEQHLYGSSRLGMYQWDTTVSSSPPIVQNNNPIYDSALWGSRTYELTNHLGNVLATINDKKVGFKLGSSIGVDYYLPEVLAQNDYYPFGMLMPGRQYSVGKFYRFGFNGKEDDNEVKGEGNQLDYGRRIYDSRVGRFLSIDPLENGFPQLTPFQFASNSPIANIDLDGEESKYFNFYFEQLYNAQGKLTFETSHQVEDKSRENNGTAWNRILKIGSWIMGNAKTGTAIALTVTIAKIDKDGKLTQKTYNLGEAYYPGKDDTKKGGLYLVSKESGGYNHSGDGELAPEDMEPISIDLLVSAAGMPTGGGEVKEISELKEALSNPKVLEKILKVEETIGTVAETFENGKKVKEAIEGFKEALVRMKEENKVQKMKEKYAKDKVVHCIECNGNFETNQKDSTLTFKTSDKPAQDTVEYH